MGRRPTIIFSGWKIPDSNRALHGNIPSRSRIKQWHEFRVNGWITWITELRELRELRGQYIWGITSITGTVYLTLIIFYPWAGLLRLQYTPNCLFQFLNKVMSTHRASGTFMVMDQVKLIDCWQRQKVAQIGNQVQQRSNLNQYLQFLSIRYFREKVSAYCLLQVRNLRIAQY